MTDGTDTPSPSSAPGGPPTGTVAYPGGPQEPPPDPQPAAGSWQLRRSVRDRKVRGVAGGVATAADIEPTLVRLLFVVAALSWWGIVAYIVLAVVLPDETPSQPSRALTPDQRRLLRIGLGVGALVAVGRLLDGVFFRGNEGLPLALIAVGAIVLWARRDRHPAAAGGTGLATPIPGDAATAAGRPPSADPTEPLGPTPVGATSSDQQASFDQPSLEPAPFGPASPPWPLGPPPPQGPRWRSTAGDLLRLAAAFVAVGAVLTLVAGTFLVVFGAVPMRLPVLPGVVGLLALAGLVTSVVRRSGPARLFVSGGVLVVAVALAVGLTSFPAGAGERIVTASAANPLLERYDHGAGNLVLDLVTLPLPAGETRRLVATVGAGQLTVIVPRTTSTVGVRSRVGAGATVVFGRERGGPGIDMTEERPGPGAGGRLDLDLKVGVGRIQVLLPEEPTFRVSCSVTEDAAGTGPVTCPHPAGLAGQAMTCSILLAAPDGGVPVGQGSCRRLGAQQPPDPGGFAVSCTVPADSDTATCRGLTPSQLNHLRSVPDAAPPGPDPAPGGTTDVGPLRCGPPDAAGERTCTAVAAASTTSSVPTSYRCSEDSGTHQLTCLPIGR